jgi:hypothetical protein
MWVDYSPLTVHTRAAKNFLWVYSFVRASIHQLITLLRDGRYPRPYKEVS